MAQAKAVKAETKPMVTASIGAAPSEIDAPKPNANKDAVNNARIRYILLLSSAFAERCERTARGHVNGSV